MYAHVNCNPRVNNEGLAISRIRRSILGLNIPPGILVLTRSIAAWTRAFNIAYLELSLGDCHIAIVTVVTQFRHCRSWISQLVFIFVRWSVMNVVMVLDNNQNNILPYRSRFLQMPKVEIQGLFNAHLTFTVDSNCSTSYCQYKIVEIFGCNWSKGSI